MRSSAGHRACVRTATAPAISFQTSCQVPMRRALMRRESQIIGLAPHQGNLVIRYSKLTPVTTYNDNNANIPSGSYYSI